VFTFAPSTPALAAMHRVGRLFPRSSKAPAIQPVAEPVLLDRIGYLREWTPVRARTVSSGFYTSRALELVKS
jgi:magnesium-protoporphyrin O-methyltransferase